MYIVKPRDENALASDLLHVTDQLLLILLAHFVDYQSFIAFEKQRTSVKILSFHKISFLDVRGLGVLNQVLECIL